MKRIKEIIFGIRLKRAIRKANEIQKNTGYKCIVLTVKGKPKVFTKQTLKKLIKVKYFRKGTKISDLEKIALYIT